MYSDKLEFAEICIQTKMGAQTSAKSIGDIWCISVYKLMILTSQVE